MSLLEVDKLLRSLGLSCVRQWGSHWYYKDARGRRLGFAVHGKRVSHETLAWIYHDLRKMGLPVYENRSGTRR